jgi:hypothetical protein
MATSYTFVIVLVLSAIRFLASSGSSSLSSAAVLPAFSRQFWQTTRAKKFLIESHFYLLDGRDAILDVLSLVMGNQLVLIDSSCVFILFPTFF